MTDKVRVLVRGRQTITYAQDREISMEDWEEYQRMCDEDPADIDKAFEWLIETSDVCDADDIEDIEIELIEATSSSSPKGGS